MSIRIGINGYGRIGSVALRIAMQDPDFEIAAINVRTDEPRYLAYMTKYDTVFGRFSGTVDYDDNNLIINGKKIPVLQNPEAKDIPWGEVGAEYIIDASGAYLTTEAALPHITEAGAKKVIMSAPAKDKVTPTFVYGVNQDKYTKDMNVVSNASCTTNCLAPLCKVLNDSFGIEEGFMSTIHASTSKQKTVDGKNVKDWRAGRSVYGNIIPSTTGAAKAVGLVIPELAGKLTGNSYRIPVADASVVDLSVRLKTDTTIEEIRRKMKEASEGPLKGVMEYVDEEVVSADFIGSPIPTEFDARQSIGLNSRFFKLVAFYDNEWGYTANLLRFVKHMAETDAE